MAGPFGIIRYGRGEMTEYGHVMADGSADIEPGMLLERVNDAGEVKVQPHGTDAGTDVDPQFAVEDSDVGMNAQTGDTAGSEPDVYSTTGQDFVKYVRASGGGLYALLAAGENVTADTALVSAGDGTLRAIDTAGGDPVDATVARTEESLDLSGASDAQLVEVVPSRGGA